MTRNARGGHRDRPPQADRRQGKDKHPKPPWHLEDSGLAEPAGRHPRNLVGDNRATARLARAAVDLPRAFDRVFVGWVGGDPANWAETADLVLAEAVSVERLLAWDRAALLVVGFVGVDLPAVAGAPDVSAGVYPVRLDRGRLAAAGSPAVLKSVTSRARGDGSLQPDPLAFNYHREPGLMRSSMWALTQLAVVLANPSRYPSLTAARGPAACVSVTSAVDGDGVPTEFTLIDLFDPDCPPVDSPDEVMLRFGPEVGVNLNRPDTPPVPGLAPWAVLPGSVHAFGARLGAVTAACVL